MRKGLNPRQKNGAFRRKMRARFEAMDAPCEICQGKLGRIHYEEKSCSDNPLSFVIDERLPVSRWRENGYESPEAVCMDVSNLCAAHWICNAKKSNKMPGDGARVLKSVFVTDGNWKEEQQNG